MSYLYPKFHYNLMAQLFLVNILKFKMCNYLLKLLKKILSYNFDSILVKCIIIVIHIQILRINFNKEGILRVIFLA